MCIGKKYRLVLRGLLMLVFAWSITPLSANAQDSAKVVQFSGYVVTPDSLVGIPFVNIRVEGKNRGSYSNADGYFSFAAAAGDTVMFSCFGFEDDRYIIPSALNSNKYSIVKLMTEDYAYLDSVIIYPWPTREMFRAAFLDLELAESDVDRFLRNMEREYLQEMAEALPMDAQENADRYLRAEAQKYYWAGQAPPQNIFNVFAWAQFIEAWKRGDFKRRR
ncbi:MAG TPA: hypothetical protein DCF84_04245 [Bacteroidetes bacterium]|nr:hypothetical protein [Bacteroidota bacterium]